MVPAQRRRHLRQPGRLGRDLGRPGGADNHVHVELWEAVGRDAFLTWCRRGVDGFRCDAGYKVPVPAWQYIVARVAPGVPQTHLPPGGPGRGLGGHRGAAHRRRHAVGLLGTVPELRPARGGRLPGPRLRQSARASASWCTTAKPTTTSAWPPSGRAWSLLRNRLCALASVSAAASASPAAWSGWPRKKSTSTGRPGMAWGNPDNLVAGTGRLNACWPGIPASSTAPACIRLSPVDSPVWALRRDSAEGLDAVLVLINTDVDHPRSLVLNQETVALCSSAPGDGGAGSAGRAASGSEPMVRSPRPAAPGHHGGAGRGTGCGHACRRRVLSGAVPDPSRPVRRGLPPRARARGLGTDRDEPGPARGVH